MIHIKKISLCITLVVLTIMMVGCGLMSNKNEIKKSFEEKLSIYPIKHLEDFYDKEGFRDSEFDKNDKGTWYLYSKMAIQTSGDKDLISKGMVLRINRNTRTSEGEYIIRTTGNSKSVKKYPVKMVNNHIIPKEPITDKKVLKEIEDFKFFVQYANFKDLNSYGQGDFDYNPNVPSYSAEYQLSNDDYNVKQLRKRYDIPSKHAPKLLLKGIGEFKGSSIGYQQLEIQFEESKNRNIYFNDFIKLKPSK
ncbi:tandem-type lipoprotein [Staphylococcus hyicus]|uniref:tandem-type lipoprotein n=1 Tax=Staphylococcus hyicus TaxID=1284 RepID=UPI00211C9F22|nr:tandem-type lipoprotein [Staphylococcus hyicus]MCQ9291531.1 tandem-type lipoprotein [Staphylococcus hyicus]MCQ9306772.1 tandem-type lipoprotein [Staphylococcus hyicus]MCQ9309589.1 tandem-type lipoprotein [Staphylococcus hyicus]MCQ9311606.1 tandem-type lipoprotein [Staphylococcus hyicus]MDP4448643.1 tandem-type lipoprotein [Staphylococcus hyicus]